MHIIQKLRRIFNRDTKIKLIILLAAIVIGALLETFALSILAPFMNILMDHNAIQTNRHVKLAYDFLGFSSISSFLALMIFFLAAVYIFRGIYLYAVSKLQYRFITRRQVDLSDRLLRKILCYPYLYHSNKNLAELQRIIITDVQNLFILITSFLLFLTDLFMTLFILLFLTIVSPLMTLCVCVLAMLCVLVYLKVFRKQVYMVGEDTRNAQIGMNKSVNQALGGIKEIKLFRREGYFYQSFKKCSDIFIIAYTKYRLINILPKLVIESVCFGGAFIIVGALIIGGVNITELIPQFGVFVLAAFRLLPAVSRQINYLNDIIFYRSSVDAVYKSLFEEECGFIQAPPPSAPPIVNSNDIIVSELTFQYPDTLSPALENVSLVIPEKKSVAFVGSSGAGKTTLTDLILGILAPEFGGIFYKGKSIHHSVDGWNRCVGYVPQQIYLLDETIKENVAFGIDKEEIDEEKVWRALKQAQLTEFVRSLPQGLETVVGDRGVRLSGGQRQRIGIARAMYEDPPIFVLDEATSSLDSETEKAVLDAVIGLQGNKTMLIVAHRANTIKHCDIIYRVENNTVIRER